MILVLSKHNSKHSDDFWAVRYFVIDYNYCLRLFGSKIKPLTKFKHLNGKQTDWKLLLYIIYGISIWKSYMSEYIVSKGFDYYAYQLKRMRVMGWAWYKLVNSICG